MFKTEELGMPGVGSKVSSKKTLEGYSVKYIKADMDDAGSLAILEAIETRSLVSDEIILVDKDKYTFLEKYFIIMKYLEKNIT